MINRISTPAEKRLLNRVAVILALFCAAYAGLFFYYDILPSAVTLAVVSFLCLIAPFLDKLSLYKSSRVLLSLLCCVGTLAISLTADTNAEYYYLIALIIPALIFRSEERVWIYSVAALAPAFWLSQYAIDLQHFYSLAPESYPNHLLTKINFFGTICTLSAALVFFINRYNFKKNELQQNFQRLEFILDGAELGAWDWWIDTNRVEFDARWLKMIGLPPTKAAQHFSTWQSRLHPEDYDRSTKLIHDFVEGRIPFYENIHRLRHQNGSWVWILARGKISLRSDEGRTLKFTGSHFEITQLKESQNLLNTIQKISKIGGWELDVNTLATKWTDEIYSIYDLPKDLKPSTEQMVSYYAAHEHDRVRMCIYDCMNGKSFRETFEFTDSKGVRKWVEAMGQPVYDSGGRVSRLHGTFQDVTEQKIIQDNFQTAQTQLEEAQRIAKIGSWAYDIFSQKISWSRQMFEIYSQDPSKGPPSVESTLAAIHPEDVHLWTDNLTKSLKQGSTFRIRYRVISRQHNKTTWVEAYGAARFNPQGQVSMMTGTCQDITDIVQMEELNKMEKAKALQAAKLASLGEMAAGVAHEINNPLSIVTGYTQLLNQQLDLPKQYKPKLDAILRATERITKIVAGLRKFSRSSEQSCHKDHSLLEIINEALILTDSHAKRESVHVQVEFDTQEESEMVDILCDDIEIAQVFVNLINNGIDAVRDIPQKWIKISVSESSQHYLVRITDSGKGIKSEIAQKLFQPFFTTKVVGQGTGLGLSIVKGILDDHRATIELINTEFNTCFEIKFNKIRMESHVA